MRGNTELIAGSILLVLVILVLAFGQFINHFDYATQNLPEAFSPMSATHPLGTDNLGRDIWQRLVYGGRVDLLIASLAVVFPFVLGVILGAISGFFGGWVDMILMRLADIASAFPFYILIISLVFVLGAGAQSIVIAITFVSWVAYARLVRSETLVLTSQEFVTALRTEGFTTSYIITRHVIPNVLSQSAIYAMSDIVMNIGVIVTLSYFGLGITPPTPDWGQMMSDGQQFFAVGQYGMTLAPGIAAVIVSLALSWFGDGIAKLLKTSN
ncbi:MAG: ABC transporter permease [Bifidobacterium sp.]|nr:ABC transporter permease [Bifidobacterium sp.]